MASQSLCSASMTVAETRARSRNNTQVKSLGRSVPKVFTLHSRRRFENDRRRRYVARIPGKPSDAQAALIQSLIRLEWSALKAEAQDTLQGDREGREHRRLLLRLLAEFEETLTKPPVPEKPSGVDAVLAEMTG